MAVTHSYIFSRKLATTYELLNQTRQSYLGYVPFSHLSFSYCVRRTV